MSSNMRIRAQVMDLGSPRVRIYTRDAARRPSRDTLLSAEPTARNAAMLGKAWVGNFTARLGELSSTARAIVIDEAQRALAAYAQNMHCGTMGPGNAGSLATDRPEMEFSVGTDATPEDLNAAAREFWDTTNRSVTRDAPPRDAMQAKLQDMNRANAEFWQRQTAHQKTPAREWGKG